MRTFRDARPSAAGESLIMTNALGTLGPVHALFQRRVAGDDSLLKLAGLRFAQMGLAAELYADTPEELEHVLRFVPPHPRLPVVRCAGYQPPAPGEVEAAPDDKLTE